jgi:hypothetical protein
MADAEGGFCDVSEPRWRVRFETVSPFRYPQAYGPDERARLPIEAIPEDWWHEVVADQHENRRSAQRQLDGLRKLQAEREYIRNVRLESQEVGPWRLARKVEDAP